MNTFLGASESLSAKEIDREALKTLVVYIEGYLVTDEPRTQATKEALSLPKKTESRSR